MIHDKVLLILNIGFIVVMGVVVYNLFNISNSGPLQCDRCGWLGLRTNECCGDKK